MYTVWHVDKYEIISKLVINWTNEILYHIVVSSGFSRPGIIDARTRYRAAIRQLKNTALENIVNATNQSKHVKSQLKKTILESVSTFRNIFHALQKDILDNSAKSIDLQTEVDQVKRELQAYRDTRNDPSGAIY